MEFLKRCENTIVEASNKINRKMTAMCAGSVFAASAFLCSVSAFADNEDIASFGASITAVVAEVYKASFGVITILAALLLIFAFIVRMLAPQQKAQQATSWIIRIIVCYIAINCIGVMFNVIESTTAGMGFDDRYSEYNLSDPNS